MKILLIFLLLCALIFEKAIDQIEAGKISQEKSFAEIFGQRWDDGAEENICQIYQIMHGETVNQNQYDQQFDHLEVKEEESEEMSTDCDELGQLPMSTNNEQIYDQIRILNDKQKRGIVEKFHKIKEKVKQMEKKYSTKEWVKIERKIGQKLGVSYEKIYKWKREFGMMIKNSYSYEQKVQILKRFDQIYGKLKNKLNEKLKGKREKCQKIIAKHLGISLKSIYKWKKQLKDGKMVKKQRTDDEKREIVEKYLKIKNDFMQMGKHSLKEWKEFRAKIKQIFGVNYWTIERWDKKLGIKQNISKAQKVYTIVEKMELMKQYYQLKRENNNLSDRKIAEYLKISTASLARFKVAFKEE